MNETVRILRQDKIWIDRNGKEFDLETMDPSYRSNLIPFLRGNSDRLQLVAHLEYMGSDLALADSDGDGIASARAHEEAQYFWSSEDWLERTPLMRKLVALEEGIPLLTRKMLSLRNKAYEIAHGYKKIRTNKN